jgi:XTP/dITP diphosphohydrolase
MQLLIASNNVHKIREIRSMLGKKQNFDILSLLNFPHYQTQEEVGKTFEENASLKAKHAAEQLNILTLADDSGLVVPALSGEPGIFSARYAGPDASDKENRQKLLERMQGLTGHQRVAYFTCAIALADPRGVKKCVTGSCEGTILEKERGGNGFGYDPLFLKNDYGKTFAEMEEEVKNRVSHRRKAIDKMLLVLESL